MFSPDAYIDAFQSTKRVLTNQIIKDPTLNKAANAFIDAQSSFAKSMARNTIDLTKYSVDTFTSYWFPKKEGTA